MSRKTFGLGTLLGVHFDSSGAMHCCHTENLTGRIFKRDRQCLERITIKIEASPVKEVQSKLVFSSSRKLQHDYMTSI
jgi:hypothetical protein